MFAMINPNIYQVVKEVLAEKGWLCSDNAEDEEFILFYVDGVQYAILKKDNGRELSSLCIMTIPVKFDDKLIPDIYIAAAIVNNRHSCARIAIHSHVFEGPCEEGSLSLFGCEFHIPKSCIGNVSVAIEEGVAQLSAIYTDFIRELEESNATNASQYL